LSKLYVKVPSDIIRNENIHLKNDEFLIYARICFLYFRNYQNKNIELDHKKLMQFVKISDTRTFKGKLVRLYELELIENKVDKLPTKGSLVIVLNDKLYEEDKHFTIINANVFTYIKNGSINYYAFRQLLYYKSHINKDDKERDRSFCFVAYQTLSERLKIGKTKIKEANDQLVKCKLLKITKHKLKTNHEYDDEDELLFDRFNNHYHLHNTLF